MKQASQQQISPEIAQGIKPPPLVDIGRAQVNSATVPALSRLQSAASAAGYELEVVSGYRDFERQLCIWNAKASGQRPVLDACGAPVQVERLTEESLMYAILRWSALPGGSRHHWGTDFDVIDRSAISAGYNVSLTVAETEGDGPFAAFHRWLARYLAADEAVDFFKPYQFDRGAIAPEPWHLSHTATARECQRALEPTKLKKLIANSAILLKEPIIDNFDDIFSRFIWVDWSCYPTVPKTC